MKKPSILPTDVCLLPKYPPACLQQNIATLKSMIAASSSPSIYDLLIMNL